MSSSEQQLGERMAALEASFNASNEYQHERWHRLANDLQPIIALPERITRDVAKMQGLFEGKITSVAKEIDRSITAAIEKALKPVNDDITALKNEVAALQAKQNAWTGAKMLAVWVIQTAIAAVVAVVALGGKH